MDEAAINPDKVGRAYQAAKRELWRQEQSGRLTRASEGPIGLMTVAGELNLSALVISILRSGNDSGS